MDAREAKLKLRALVVENRTWGNIVEGSLCIDGSPTLPQPIVDGKRTALLAIFMQGS